LGFETRAERDLMLVLHRPIEPDTQSGHLSRPLHHRRHIFETLPLDEIDNGCSRPFRLFLHHPVTRFGDDTAGYIGHHQAHDVGHLRAEGMIAAECQSGIVSLPSAANPPLISATRPWVTGSV
jgi:hypothetical protein